MHFERKLTLHIPNLSPLSYLSATASSSPISGITTRSESAATPTVTHFAPSQPAIPDDHGSGGNCNVTEASVISVPIPTGLKPSYLILDEDIPFSDAFSILGRLVANVKCPLQEYTPSQVIHGAKIPGIDEPPTVLKPKGATATKSSGKTTFHDGRGVSGDEAANFARGLEEYTSTLVFSNLPFTTSSSTTATITHKSQYSTRTSSLITAMLGISISSSKTATTTYRLESALIRTLCLTQHNLVWTALLGHEQYKQEIMTAVRRNHGKMFFVVGLKVARDAEVQKEISRSKAVSGKLQVDVGSGVGVQGSPRVERIAGRQGGEMINMGVVGSRTNEVVGEGGRKERLLGDRAFAVEYREVKLKIKLEMGGKKGNKGSDPVKMEAYSKWREVEVCRKPVPDATSITEAQCGAARAMLSAQSKSLPKGNDVVKSEGYLKRGATELRRKPVTDAKSITEAQFGAVHAWREANILSAQSKALLKGKNAVKRPRGVYSKRGATSTEVCRKSVPGATSITEAQCGAARAMLSAQSKSLPKGNDPVKREGNLVRGEAEVPRKSVRAAPVTEVPREAAPARHEANMLIKQSQKLPKGSDPVKRVGNLVWWEAEVHQHRYPMSVDLDVPAAHVTPITEVPRVAAPARRGAKVLAKQSKTLPKGSSPVKREGNPVRGETEDTTAQCGPPKEFPRPPRTNRRWARIKRFFKLDGKQQPHDPFRRSDRLDTASTGRLRDRKSVV